MTATRRTPQSQHNRSVSGWRSLYGPTRFDRSPCDESSASSCMVRDERFAGASRLIRCTLGHLSLITTMFLFTTPKCRAYAEHSPQCSMGFASTVVSMKSPTHHTATYSYNISQWWNAGMGNTDTQFLFLFFFHQYFRIKFLLLVCIVFMRMRAKPHPHPVIS